MQTRTPLQPAQDLIKFVPLASFKSHLTNLLRDKAHHKYQHRGRKQKGTHVGKAAPSKECIKIIR